MLCYVYNFALLGDVFYLRTKKRKAKKNEKRKIKPWGEGISGRGTLTRVHRTFPFANFPLLKIDFEGQDKKTYFLGGKKRDKGGQKE
jgi:hypothetical protein